MKVSTKGRYALRLMIDLASDDSGTYVSLREIAQRQEISMKYMEQIVSTLQKAGMLESTRGPLGGYRLSRPPAQYTLGELLRVTEGNIAPVTCLEVEPNPCHRASTCDALPFWEEYYAHLRVFLDNKTLQDLINESESRNRSFNKADFTSHSQTGV